MDNESKKPKQLMDDHLADIYARPTPVASASSNLGITTIVFTPERIARIEASKKALMDRCFDDGWLPQLHTGADIEPSCEFLGDLYERFHQGFVDGKFKQIDSILLLAKLDRMHPDAMIAILCYSFVGKFKLEFYDHVLRSVRRELDRRGIDPEPELRGL